MAEETAAAAREAPAGAAQTTYVQCAACKLKGHKDSILTLDIHHAASLLASGSEDKTARVWDLKTGKSVRCMTSFFDSVNSVCFAPNDENTIFVASGPKIHRFDMRRSEIVLSSCDQEFAFNTEEINQLALSVNGEYLAACDDAAEVKVVQWEKNRLFKTLRSQHTNICSSLSFRGRSKPWELITGGLDCQLVQWDFSKGRTINVFHQLVESEGSSGRPLVNPPFVHSVDIHPTYNSLLVAALESSDLVIYDLTAAQRVALLEGHSAAASQARFARFDPDRLILSASGVSNDIIIWQSSLLREQETKTTDTTAPLWTDLLVSQDQ
ncbi:WD repeat-containing protein 53, partial [Balamuthia mandrillaris]